MRRRKFIALLGGAAAYVACWHIASVLCDAPIRAHSERSGHSVSRAHRTSEYAPYTDTVDVDLGRSSVINHTNQDLAKNIGVCPPSPPTPSSRAGGAFLTVIFGQIFAYSAFSDSHFSSPGSVSALMASTGHSGSQTPQSMHSSGWITSIFSPS